MNKYNITDKPWKYNPDDTNDAMALSYVTIGADSKQVARFDGKDHRENAAFTAQIGNNYKEIVTTLESLTDNLRCTCTVCSKVQKILRLLSK